MELIAGFAWPVPRAMVGAVSACRFEQGDVLYSQAKAYQAWPKGLDGLKFGVQVLDPPKSARALGPEAEGNRFEANWSSPVELELTDYAKETDTRLVTTQGRLFCALWHGDPAQLDPENSEPAPPVLQRDLHRRLEEAEASFSRRFKSQSAGPPTNRAFARGFSLYLAAVDDANESARGKAKAVEAVLSEKFEVVSLWLSPSEAGLADAQALHPALRIQGLAIPAQKPDAIETRLRGLLYGGAGESGRFSLARHGLLLAVAPD